MYLDLFREVKGTICCIGAPLGQVGEFEFPWDTSRFTQVPAYPYLYQEVTMIPIPTPKENAAVAPAASSARLSAIQSNHIVPLLYRNAAAFCSSFSRSCSLKPHWTYKTLLPSA
jgi:hypothetical protein